MRPSHVEIYVVAAWLCVLFPTIYSQALLRRPLRNRRPGQQHRNHRNVPGLFHPYRRQQGSLPSILESCCTVGKEWFSISRERCSLHPGPFEGVQEEDTMSCQAIVEVCCLKEKADKQCTQGKQISRIRQSCDALHSQLGNSRARECCGCCKLGQVAKQSLLPCTLLNDHATYTQSCKTTFTECCIGDDTLTTTTTPAPTLAPQRPDTMNECEQFSNMLCAHVCIDTPTSYRCACHPGHTLQADGRTCKQDVTDRCQVNNPCQHLCVDTGTAINCRCLDGFILKPDGRTCEDEDECKIGTHTCQPEQKCVNSPGSFACEGPSRPSPSTCPRGYVYNGITRTCEDLDECRLTPGLCSVYQMCVNTGGSYTCVARNPNDHTSCDPGYHFDVRTHSCEDFDECATGTHNCHARHQVCQNQVGSFECRCERGFETDPVSLQCEDINECLLNQDACLEGQNCDNTVGSYVCRRAISCGTGYTLDRASQTCKDDDECGLGSHNCGLGRDCQNTQGSFRCVEKQCPRGTRLDFTTGVCTAVNCPRGLRPDRAGNCLDVNECTDTPSVCRPSQQCLNTIGSYTCRNLMTCGNGYELNEQGNACLDIDECERDIDECERDTHDCKGPLMTCINRRGTYMCDCPEGYRTNHAARRCEDIDECSRYGGQVCSPNSQCENTPGSFMCTCNDGFEAEGSTCKDLDECVTQEGLCQHTCHNTWGSYRCSCNKGYQITADKKTCEDVDECAQYAGGGLCPGQCNNTPGSFTCSCPEGFSLMEDGRTCQDIDECALRTANCRGTDKLCINTRGGFKCETIACPKGFVRAPSLGNANNNIRCQRQTFVCSQGDTECLFAPLSYSMNFITFPSHIQIPADLFTMRGPYSHYRRLEFDLKLISAEDPITKVARVTPNFFNLRRVSTNEAVVQLMQKIDGPQDIELELDMNIYSKEFRDQGKEVFFGTAVARIKIYVTENFRH